MPRDPKVGVGTAIIVIEEFTNEIWLLKRKGAHAQGTFACPGGWVDFDDESPEDAAARELKEELGLSVSPYELEQVCNVSEKHEDLGIRTVTLYYRVFINPETHGVPKRQVLRTEKGSCKGLLARSNDGSDQTVSKIGQCLDKSPFR